MAKALLLGNGPSLLSLKKDQINQYDLIFVCNYFCVTELASKIKIDYYCASDPRLFVPPNLKWLFKVYKLKPRHFVYPRKHSWLNIFFKNNFTFNYSGHKKIWLEKDFNMDIRYALPSGDTVMCDIMIPLAFSLNIEKIGFAGLDLKHTTTVEHAYDESRTGNKRRSDEYLKGVWQSNSTQSILKQLKKLEQSSIEFEFLTGYYKNINCSEGFKNKANGQN